ncbi:outer membrane protein [Rhodoplanes roseus]|uniref:Outer membrane protein beta-barrel domain-containing protein n=1 Tax=Rhodoplanes roseus TaxID=29409 RepID=A0A327KJ56_9BRAD|nr:outer membrane beta-barrel protein [Rhodoplanes roseus]RAI38799.1 hypothetical protein CH341_27155 [Rhodoplanes roseus]
MKTMLLATTALVAFGIGSAMAADLRPAYKAPPPPPPAPVASWSGCYVGAGAGYGMWNQDHNEYDLVGAPISLSSTSGGRGWFGTVGAGCDYQFAPSWVLGVFGDYDFASLSGDTTIANGLVGEEKLKWQWAVGGRLGYVVVPQLLAYVSGGYTQAHFDGYSAGFPGVPAATVSIDSRTRDGWFIGSGYEYQLGWIPGLTWKTEYRFSDFSSKTDTIFDVTGAPVGYSDSHKYVQTIRSELVYRFNFGGAAPVMARY